MNKRQAQSLPDPAQLVGRQQCVHGPRAKSFQVERYKLEAELFEDRRELPSHGGIQGAAEFFLSDLDTNNVSVMPHAELAKAESANCVLAALDHIEGLTRDRAAILDAGRKTC